MATLNLVLSDAEALALVVEGDDEAFRLIVERYLRRVLTYVARKFRLDGHRAVGITQETFFRLFCMIKRDPNVWLKDKTLHALLVSIAGAAAVDELRQEKARSDLHNKLILFPVTEAPRPDEAVLAAEIVSVVREALAKMPPTLQIAAILRFVEDYSCTEVARLTHTSPGTARGRIDRARQLLIATLEPFWKGVNT